ncbi:MAG: hypothetical protein BHW26_03980 [Faecalibacterium prausnitzii]|nr:MAG: hypothetical protein BHW26_03980 [Faecalibacterium prausnitzii]
MEDREPQVAVVVSAEVAEGHLAELPVLIAKLVSWKHGGVKQLVLFIVVIGFVQIIPCKGTIVTAIDIGVVDQLIFQRVAVEGMVFRDFVQSSAASRRDRYFFRVFIAASLPAAYVLW